MIKPTLKDYMSAAVDTQGTAISLAVMTIAFLGYGLVMDSHLAVNLSLGFCVLGACVWMKQCEPVERIKTKAVVIAARRKSGSKGKNL